MKEVSTSLIKDRLISSKVEDPEVKFMFDCDKEVFFNLPFIKDELLHQKWGHKYFVIPNQTLTEFFGPGCNYHIHNRRKEFTYVVNGTFQLYLYKKKPRQEFVVTDGVMREQLTPRGHQLVYSFVSTVSSVPPS